MAQNRDIPTLNNANYLAVLQANGLSEDQFWSKTLQRMIVLEQKEFVFTRLAKKERIPKKAGTKVWSTRRYLHLPVDLDKGVLTEGLAPKPMTVEGKMVSGTVKQYGAYIELTDVAADIHFDDIMGIYQPELSRHAAETIERDLIAAINAEASVAFTGTAKHVDDGTEAAKLAVLKFDDVRRAGLAMRNHRRRGHSLAGGKPIVVVHPNVVQDLLDDTNVVKELIIVPGYDSKIIKSGTINEYTIYGVHIMETAVLEPVLVGSTHVYNNYVIGEDAFVQLALGSNDVAWYRKGFTADSNDPLGQKSTLGYKLWTGGKIIDPMAIKVIYSKSGFDAADWSIDEDARPAVQGGFGANSVLRFAKLPVGELSKNSGAGVLDKDEVKDAIITFTDDYGTEIIIPLETAGLTFTTTTDTLTASYTVGAVTKTVATTDVNIEE